MQVEDLGAGDVLDTGRVVAAGEDVEAVQADADGRVVGMTTAATLNYRMGPGGEGFAIPINEALATAAQIPMPKTRRAPDKSRTLKVIGARGNNLKNINAEIPLSTFTAVTGVSGGGKSTLVIETLYRAIAKRLETYEKETAPLLDIYEAAHPRA